MQCWLGQNFENYICCSSGAIPREIFLAVLKTNKQTKLQKTKQTKKKTKKPTTTNNNNKKNRSPGYNYRILSPWGKVEPYVLGHLVKATTLGNNEDTEPGHREEQVYLGGVGARQKALETEGRGPDPFPSEVQTLSKSYEVPLTKHCLSLKKAIWNNMD